MIRYSKIKRLRGVIPYWRGRHEVTYWSVIHVVNVLISWCVDSA